MSSTTSTTLPVGHFECYEIRRDAFAGPTVDLQDRFGLATVRVGFPERLCAPADKNDEDPDAPLRPDHLTGYRIRHPFARVFRQRVVDQFGEVLLDVVARDRLLVPSAKRLAPPPPVPPATPAVDHFQCYRVRRSPIWPRFQPQAGVKVDDQFGTITVTLRRPVRLCAPVDKNGEAPGAETHPTHLLCYQTTLAPFGDVEVLLSDQLASLTRSVIRRSEFCVPALVDPD